MDVIGTHRRGRHRLRGQGVREALAAATAAGLVAVGLALGLGGQGAAATRVETTSPPSPTRAAADPDRDAARATVSDSPAVAVAVARVIDGDTFVLTDGSRVRVLGLDSCESGTDGGPAATADARALLTPDHGATVLLRAGTRDRDRYGRLLRYVELPGGRDYASVMVRQPESGVYAGRNDAAPEYIAHLRALDVDGRRCGSGDG